VVVSAGRVVIVSTEGPFRAQISEASGLAACGRIITVVVG
jgi:hypothetical protein